MFVNAIQQCYIVIRLTYTSTKTCIKNEWHDYSEYIYPLSISKLHKGYALSKCFSFIVLFLSKNILLKIHSKGCMNIAKMLIHDHDPQTK